MSKSNVETELRLKIDPRKLNKEGREEIQAALEDAGHRIEYIAKHLVPVDMGALRASIHTQTVAWNEVHVGTNLSYAAAVEYGSVAHTPPFEPIRKWAQRHKIPQAAWAIWQKIRREGTAPHPFMRPALYMVRDKILNSLHQAYERALRKAEK